LLVAHADRGDRRQIRDAPGVAGGVRDRRCPLPSASVHPVPRSRGDAGGRIDHGPSVCRLDSGRISPGGAPVATAGLPRGGAININASNAMADRLLGFDATPLRRKFVEQGHFLYLEKFLPSEITAELVA